MTAKFLGVTELQGEAISVEQLDRMCHRYHWAARYCRGGRVLEVGCGAGQGLRILQQAAESIVAGDHSPEVLAAAIATFPDLNLSVFSAESLPFEDASFDAIILFEALYYVNANAFFREAYRVLRGGGALLVVTANKDLFDFTPSPYTTRYLGAAELASELSGMGFAVELSGYLDTKSLGLRQRILRPVKAAASKLNLVPKTMRGKRSLKKLFFGEMTHMPADLSGVPFEFEEPTEIGHVVDRRHKVLYCRATKR